MNNIILLTLCVMTLGACDAADIEDASTSASSIGAEQLQLLFASIKLSTTPDGKVINGCDEPITPEVQSLNLGAALPDIVLVIMTGGDTAPGCYGAAGEEFTLVLSEQDDFSMLFSSPGYYMPLTTQHEGVYDFAIGGPGFEYPVYQWDGAEFVLTGSIADSELPAAGN